MKGQELDYKHETIHMVEDMQNDYYIKVIYGFVKELSFDTKEGAKDEEY